MRFFLPNVLVTSVSKNSSNDNKHLTENAKSFVFFSAVYPFQNSTNILISTPVISVVAR